MKHISRLNQPPRGIAEQGSPNLDEVPNTQSAALIGSLSVAETESEMGEKAYLLQGALSLASSVAERYPQISEDGYLNYALAGSLGVMLLAQADRVDALETGPLPNVTLGSKIVIPEGSTKILKNFARRIGDLDYVATEQYSAKKSAQPNYDPEDPNPYNDFRARFLWKGGTDLGNIDEAVVNILGLKEGSRLFADPVPTVGEFRPVKITIGDKEFYTVEPKMILAWKIAHLIESFDRTGKEDKYIKDTTVLLDAFSQMYDADDLAQTTHDILMTRSDNVVVPYHNMGLTKQISDFIDAAINKDIDAPNLGKLAYGKERAVGILAALHSYERPETKDMIIEFVNSHREFIDRWTVSENNTTQWSQFLAQNPDLADEFKANFEVPDNESFAEWLATSSMRLNGQGWITERMPDKNGLALNSQDSMCLRTLPYLNEATIAEDLELLGDLLEKDEFMINYIFNNRALTDFDLHAQLKQGIKRALESFDDNKLKVFLHKVGSACYKAHRDQNVTEIETLFEEFGLRLAK